MGVLLFVIWSQWIPRNRVFCCLILAWVFLSAGADEIHQLFVNGRDGNMMDVLIDTLGGAFGLFVSFRIARLFRRRRGK